MCFLLLSAVFASAQKRVLPLEKEAQMLFVTMEDTDSIYFKDVNHILDKFEGSWKGTGVGGYDITMQLKTFKKVYKDEYASYSDLLGYKLEIWKEGKKLPTPLGDWQFIPGTSWYQGDGLDLDDDNKADKDSYEFGLDFSAQRKEGYWGITSVTAKISKDRKTLTVSHGGTVVPHHEIPSYPPYIPKVAFSVAWVLHRVGK